MQVVRRVHFHPAIPDVVELSASESERPMYNALPTDAGRRARGRRKLAVIAVSGLCAVIVIAAMKFGADRPGMRGFEFQRHATVVTTRSVWAATTAKSLALLATSADAAERELAASRGELVEIPARMNLLITGRGNGWVSVTGAGLAPAYVRADERVFAPVD